MNIFEKFIYLLQTKMVCPTPYGWFHFLWLFLTFLMIFILYKKKEKSESQLKSVLLIYGLIALLLELLKQISWSFNYDVDTGRVFWDYQWYSSAFQLCTMPIYFSIISTFLKKGKLRDAFLMFMAFFTILGSISTMIIPNSCFTEDILVNIHTMFLHCGSFVVSIYILMINRTKLSFKCLINAFFVFLGCATIANILNIGFYKTGIIGDETFNMFYISPYFISSLPIFDKIQQSVPYVLFLFIYILCIFIGGLIVFLIANIIRHLFIKKKNIKKDKNNEKKLIKKIVVYGIVILLTVTLIISCIKIGIWIYDSKRNESVDEKILETVDIVSVVDSDKIEIVNNDKIENLLEDDPYWEYIKTDLIDVNFTKLKDINSDVVGWIQIDGVNVNYPYVQTSNNSYYLNHSFDKSNNNGGWLFMDYRNDFDDKNIIIYGHERFDGSLFGSLKRILNGGNYAIKTVDASSNSLWQIFSAYNIKTTSDYLTTEFSSDEEFLKFVNMLIKRSNIDFRTGINSNDKIITLSTCYGDDYKTVIHAKLIKRENK